MSQESVEASMKKPKAWTAVVEKRGFTLGIAVQDEPGYYQTDYPTVKTYDEAVKWADALNERMGVSKKDAMLIILSSMRKR